MMNSRLGKLDIYPFWRLRTLLEAEAAVRVMPADPSIRMAPVGDRNFAEDALTRIANVLNG